MTGREFQALLMDAARRADHPEVRAVREPTSGPPALLVVDFASGATGVVLVHHVEGPGVGRWKPFTPPDGGS